MKIVVKNSLVLVVWLLAVGGGWVALSQYASRAGMPAKAPLVWPNRSQLERASTKATLLVFLHPDCPCSRASLSELERLMPDLRSLVTVHIVFTDKQMGTLFSQASAIRGVTVIRDDDGRETELFGAKTSGETMLYAKNGALVFRGGITPLRGHVGDSFGRQAILEFIKDNKTTRQTASTFGCALRAWAAP